MDSLPEDMLEPKIEYLKTMCKLKGMRVTPQRIEIYKEVAKSRQHPDAEVVYEAVKNKMPNVSVDTVYRTLASLEELDMIFRIDNQLPKARFDADKTPHNHFICTKCNEVYDIFLDDYSALIPPNGAEKYGQIKDVNIQIRGICNKCLAKQLN